MVGLRKARATEKREVFSWVVDLDMYLGETVFQLLLRQSSLRTRDEVGGFVSPSMDCSIRILAAPWDCPSVLVASPSTFDLFPSLRAFHQRT